MKNAVLPLLLIALACVRGVSAPSETDPAQATVIRPVTIQHVSLASRRDFATTTREFESRLGVFDPAALQGLTEPNPPIADIRAKVEALAGSSGFMRFGRTQSLGELLPFVGRPPGRANQYLVGNPLIAVQMTQHNPAAALYAPLRVLLYEDASGVTHLEYDLPSSLFGQFQDAKITAVGVMLDQKLQALVQSAAGY